MTGVTTTIPPTPHSMQIRVSVPSVLDGTKAHRTKHRHNMLHQRMERPKDQRLLHLHATGETAPTGEGRRRPHPRPPFLFFSFIFSPFHLFITNVTQALPLKTIKGEAGATPRKRRQRPTRTHTSPRQPHTHITPQKRPGIRFLSLESL
jgi:hypothetical protein